MLQETCKSLVKILPAHIAIFFVIFINWSIILGWCRWCVDVWSIILGWCVFILTHGENELEKFMSSFNSFTSNFKFSYEPSEKDASFLDLKISLSKVS